MLVALGPIGFCLALMAFMPSLWTTALLVFAFFFAYYVYEPPYRGLYPDLLPERLYGRAQSVAAPDARASRSATALIGGGALFHVWKPWPFLVAAIVVDGRLRARRSCSCARTAATAASSRACARTSRTAGACCAASARCAGSWSRTPPGRARSPAARTFVVLYMTVGLGQPLGTTTAVLAAVAGGYIVAAAVVGRARRPASASAA